MTFETIFYACGSAFFLISSIILLVLGFYLHKIAATALSLEREAKSIADELKIKVGALSVTFAGILALLEKFVLSKNFFHRKKEDNGKNYKNENKKEKGPQKIRISVIGEND